MLGCATVPEAPVDAPAGDIGITFTELNAAAKGACLWLWANKPDAETYEYCGALYRDGDVIRVGLPMTRHGGQCGSPEGPPTPPPDTILLGKWHSHRYETEPSYKDVKIAKRYPSLGHFLCSPSKKVRRFGGKEGTVIIQ